MKDIVTLNFHSQTVCTCPHCNSASITRSGFDRGTQRYRCKSCNRTFKATAGKPAHGLHKKDKIARYLIALRKGMSVRKAADYVGISKNTSFAWRHKFLSSLQVCSVVHTESGIATAEIIQLNYSAKGRRKPPEKNTSPTRTIALLRGGQMELHKLSPRSYTRHAADVFSKSPANFFALIPHRTITTGIKHSENATKIKNRHASKPLIANAQLQTAKLLCWLDRFKGVASKYLQNYWNWYASLINIGKLKQETDYFNECCLQKRSLSQYYFTKGL